MKPLSLLATALVTIVTMFACPSAFAEKEKPTFLDFRGSYTGTAVLGFAGTSYSGPATIAFATNKTGRAATVNVSGSLVAGGPTIPFHGTITLAKGTFSVDSITLNLSSPTPVPATGSYTRTKRAISFQGVYAASPNYTVAGTIATATKGKKQKLAFTYVLSQNGTPGYTFTLDVSRPVKKK